MFTQTSTPGLWGRVLRSPLVSVLTGPHGVDSYTELVDPAWTAREARATVIEVRRSTPRSVTLTLQPNALCARLYSEFRAGGHVNLTVEVDGRRYTRCYSPANAEGAPLIELTIGRHDGGRVSTFLCDHAHPGMVVGIGVAAGDAGAFTLDRSARRILFVSGGSGITPVMSMLRTLRAEGFDGDIALRPLRAQCRGGLLRRRTRPDARRSGAARLHPLRCRRSGRSRRRRSSGRRDRRSRRGVRVRSACVGRRGPRDPPARRVGELRTRRISA